MYYEIIKNKKNLLITIGDSWTEGVGNYNPELIKDFKKGDRMSDEMYTANKPYFGENSYGAVLANLLDCDLINLGRGGASNATTVKDFINGHDLNYLERYDSVTVIFLMTEWARLGLYSNGYITDFSVNGVGEVAMKFALHYVEHIYGGDMDGMLEAKFFVKALDAFCKTKSYKFLYGQAFTNITEFDKIYNSSNNLHNYMEERSFSKVLEYPTDYAMCGHPNQRGYKIIAKRIYDIIAKNNLLKESK